MPVDREQWQEKLDALPPWRCPFCSKGALAPVAEKMVIEETGPSKADHEHDAWEPEWIRARFAGFMECNNGNCGDMVAVSGNSPVDVWVEQDWDHHQQHVSHLYAVKSIYPAPIPIKLPGAVPDNIKEAVSMGSALMWASNEAAGNQLRQVVELFLTEMGIPVKSAKGNFLTPHSRIEEFQKGDPENGEALLAVKWLGNSSSHPGGLTRDDLLNGFDIIEFVLENKYGVAKAQLKAIIAAINAAKGPAKAAP
jgi:hypothetical protein